MLNIYFGREDTDRDKFIYDNISGRTRVLVPDQFTLQAERDALFYLEANGLLDVEILSLNRLFTRVLTECGGAKRRMISREGRQMLLAKILAEDSGELDVFGELAENPDFISMANDFIFEVKQYGFTPDALEEAAETVSEKKILRRKLGDIVRVYSDYEKAIEGKYVDTEDRVSLVAEKIPGSELVRGAGVWIYGFDYFTPKNIEIISALLRTAEDVNVVLTYSEGGADDEVFSIGKIMIEKLKQCAEDAGCGSSVTRIDAEKYPVEHREPVAFVEKNLMAMPPERMVVRVEGAGETDSAKEIEDCVTLVRASNIHSEMETAACTVMELIRDRGLRLSDIVIICNDLEVRGRIAKRVFSEYGIPLFMDETRDIMSSPAARYAAALLRVISRGYRTEDMIGLLKTGLTDLSDEDADALENYAERFRIRGKNKWTSPFEKGDDEDLDRLNGLRSTRADPGAAVGAEFTGKRKASERIAVLYDFLADTAELPKRLEEIISAQRELGHLDEAQETEQIWNVIVTILEQMDEILGDMRISKENFTDLFLAGLEASQVGVLPPARDVLMTGTMQRTRTGRKRAVLVLGANEDLLPKAVTGGGILSEDEKIALADNGVEICRLDSLRVREEQIAIYRHMSGASDYLYVSCSASDEDGNKARPSAVFDSLREIFPGITVRSDIVSEALLDKSASMRLIQSRRGALPHIAEAVRSAAVEKSGLSDVWNDALNWYINNDRESAEMLRSGLMYRNEVSRIDKKRADELYKKAGRDAFSVSPSRLEKYGKCPFMHFVQYGLRPDSPRKYELGSPEVGEVCHDALMKLARSLTKQGVRVTDPASDWQTKSTGEIGGMIDDIIRNDADMYKEGLMRDSKTEVYRTERMRELLRRTAESMVGQVRRGHIEEMLVEAEFGPGKELPEVRLPGTDVSLRGKIDRLDIMPCDYAKVIDYKTGNDRFDRGEVEGGVQLQLMIYLLAAKAAGRKPAAAFYFHVNDPDIDAKSVNDPLKEDGGLSDGLMETISKKRSKDYQMNGLVMNEPGVVDSIDGSDDGETIVVSAAKADASESDETDAHSGKVFKPRSSGSGRYLGEKEFNDFLDRCEEMIADMCRELESGDIRIEPKMSGKKNISCMYCEFGGICKFDREVPGFRRKQIK